MKILKEFSEPERILTLIETYSITAKECEELKIHGYRERKRVINEYRELVTRQRIPKEIKPITYITKRLLYLKKNSTRFNSKSTLRKEIIYANALLPDNVAIAELLNNNNFTYDHLKKIIEVRSKILFLIKSQNNKIDDTTTKDIAIYQKIIAKLIKLFEQKFGINDPTIILNKICVMLVTCPTYFDTKQHTR